MGQLHNDLSEGTFATFTDILCNGGRINLSSASGIGQMRYNKDMVRGHEQFVTGRKAHKKSDKPAKLGTFHLLPVELQKTLLVVCKRGSYKARKDFSAALQRQRHAKAEKKMLIEKKKLQNAEKEYIEAWYYLFQQYHSARCWQTVSQARAEYRQLKTMRDKFYFVKEQILICDKGLGWEEAYHYHPWSRKGHTFSPDELFAHLVGVVIPLKQDKVPLEPPVSLSKPKNLTLWTKSVAK